MTERKRSAFPVLILALLFGLATFLTWYFTWFGRELTDADIGMYLLDETHPRHVQHALLQIQQRIERGDKSAKQWYPRLLQLAENGEPEYRLTTAWVMGFDNQSSEFHQVLLRLVKDSEPIVRRNAALALVRFGDVSGHAELLATLKPFTVMSPSAGTVSSTLNEGSLVARGTLLARLKNQEGAISELRSPLPGKIGEVCKKNGVIANAGDGIVTINSDSNSLWEVLRALALVGDANDLPDIERYANGVAGVADQVKEQATLTAKAVRARNSQTGQTVKQ